MKKLPEWMGLPVTASLCAALVFGGNEILREHYQDCVTPGTCAILPLHEQTATNSFSPADLDAVVATVIGEARSVENPEEIVAIVDVIFNRYALGAWGETIGDVVRYNIDGRHAFSCWNRNDPSYPVISKPGVAHDKRYKTIRALTILHLNYRIQRKPVGISNGATHYYHPASMVPKGASPFWAAKYAHVATHGGAKFYRASWAPKDQ